MDSVLLLRVGQMFSFSYFTWTMFWFCPYLPTSDVSGRQHRPTGPEHEALRYIEVNGDIGTPGPGREGKSGMVSAPADVGGPPRVRVDRPGNLVDFVPRVGPWFCPSEAAIPEAAPVLEMEAVCGRLGRARELTHDPPPVPQFHTINFILLVIYSCICPLFERSVLKGDIVRTWLLWLVTITITSLRHMTPV